MKLIIAYTQIYIKELLRNRSAAFFTLLFPAILFQFFGLHTATSADEKIFCYIMYCNYAVQTVMLQALGITVSAAKANQWNEYLKTLPVSATPMIMGRIISNLLFAMGSLMTIIILAACNHLAMLTLNQNIVIICCALFGGIPMALLAIWVGNLINATAARSVFVLLNLALLFGVFSLPDAGALATLRQFIPSYQWFNFSLSAITQQFNLIAFCWLLGYTLLFYVLSRFRHRCYQ